MSENNPENKSWDDVIKANGSGHGSNEKEFNPSGPSNSTENGPDPLRDAWMKPGFAGSEQSSGNSQGNSQKSQAGKTGSGDKPTPSGTQKWTTKNNNSSETPKSPKNYIPQTYETHKGMHRVINNEDYKQECKDTVAIYNDKVRNGHSPNKLEESWAKATVQESHRGYSDWKSEARMNFDKEMKKASPAEKEQFEKTKAEVIDKLKDKHEAQYGLPKDPSRQKETSKLSAPTEPSKLEQKSGPSKEEGKRSAEMGGDNAPKEAKGREVPKGEAFGSAKDSSSPATPQLEGKGPSKDSSKGSDQKPGQKPESSKDSSQGNSKDHSTKDSTKDPSKDSSKKEAPGKDDHPSPNAGNSKHHSAIEASAKGKESASHKEASPGESKSSSKASGVSAPNPSSHTPSKGDYSGMRAAIQKEHAKMNAGKNSQQKGESQNKGQSQSKSSGPSPGGGGRGR